MASLCTVFENARVVLPDRVENDWWVVCDGGKISYTGPRHGIENVACGEKVDAGGAFLAPGFIDLHIHGGGEWLVDDGPEALARLSGLLPAYGVTSFLAAVCPRPDGRDIEFLSSLAGVSSAGASVIGFLIEGRFLSLRGALPKVSGSKSDPECAAGLVDAARPRMAVFAISPEYPGISELLPMMTTGDIPAFITHTRAGVAETRAAIAAGARHATHFYDVFYSPDETDLGVRPCGAVEAVLADTEVSVDFILDGEHVDPVAVRTAMQCKGPDKVCMITDANRGAGMPPGRYSFGGGHVEFARPGAPARYTADHPQFPGALAGSGLTMDQALRNAVTMLEIDVPLAVRLVSTNPARVLGLSDRKGRIQEGYDADLVLLDESLRPLATWVGGVRKYCRSDANHGTRPEEEKPTR